MQQPPEEGTFNLLPPSPRLPREPAPPARPDQQRTLRLAWRLLLSAFGVFVLTLMLSTYTVLAYREGAAIPQEGTLIVRAPAEWVTWQRTGRTTFERAHDQQTLEPGDRVRIVRSAGYGQAATVRLFDTSTIDMWAGADLRLRRMDVSRWNNERQRVIFQQFAGYVRYDLRDGQPYDQVEFLVEIGDTLVRLIPGGSYSIEIIAPQRQITFADTEIGPPIEIDVAVRAGRATLESQGETETIQASERVLVDPSGYPSTPQPAQWQLIRDGSFTDYTEEEYNNTTITDQPTLIRSNTWQINSGSSDSAANGFFRLASTCPPPAVNSCAPSERINAARFVRRGNQTKNFTTGVIQPLGPDGRGIDISEYRSLVFSLWVRVDHQSIALAGEQGTECPVMVRLLTKHRNPTDDEEENVICFYSTDDPARQPERSPGIVYQAVPPGEWYFYTVDLRSEELRPLASYLRNIEIYANGHDYDSRVTAVSLIGSHYHLGE
jgi:hypothetical protein